MTKHKPFTYRIRDQLQIKCQLGGELESEFGKKLVNPLWIHLSVRVVWLLRGELQRGMSA